MKDRREIKISQCMIVKNEEKNIERALSWGKKWFLEQIVVDTGSIDKTVELAEQFGAKIYHFEWIDDFAAAKNYAIEQAKGDWIAFLDADEYPASGDEEKIFQLVQKLQEKGFDGIRTAWLQLNDEKQVSATGTQIRIFKNHPNLRYRRRIHEQLGYTNGQEMQVFDASREIAILHEGYLQEVLKEKVASKRNQCLIEKELSQHPDDYEMMGYLGDEYYGTESLEEAEKWYQRSIQTMPRYPEAYDQRSAVTFCRQLQLLSEKDEKAFLELYKEAVERMNQEPDFDYIWGWHYLVKGARKEALPALERALGKLEKYGYTNKGMMLAGNLREVYQALASGYYQEEELEKSASYSLTLLQADPWQIEPLCILLEYLRKSNTITEKNTPIQIARGSLEALQGLYGNSLRDRLFLIQASRKIPWKELEDVLYTLLSPEEAACLQEVWRRQEESRDEK